MVTGQLDKVLDHLHRFAADETTRGLTDTQLVERFARQQDQNAFAGLVRRHGPSVWNVCRRVLAHHHDAEDAFQVTFLVLARQAASMRKIGSVAAWLHGTAYRSALEIRRKAARRRIHERKAQPMAAQSGENDLAWRELQGMLDEELQRLPEKYRVPFVLCCLDGQSKAETALQLGWKEGTVSGRLAEARKRLQQRLARRGVTLSAVLCGVAVAAGSRAAALPGGLVTATIRAGVQWAAGVEGLGCAVSAEVMAGAKAVMGAMSAGRRVLTVLLLLVLSAGVAGMGLALSPGEPKKDAPLQPGAERIQAAGEERKPLTDLHGDPLPRGALARLGTVRGRAPGAAIAITADGKEVVTINHDLMVRRFDALTGEPRGTRQLPCDRSSRFVRLSPKGNFVLVFPNVPRGLEVWDLAEGKLRQTFSLIGSQFWSADISPDENHVALADTIIPNLTHHRVLILDLKTGQSRVLWSLKKEKSISPYVPMVQWSPDSKRLVSTYFDMVLRCWDIAEGKLLWESKEDPSWWPFLFFSGDGRALLSSTKGDSGWHLRNVASGKPLEWKRQPLPDSVYPTGFSLDSRLLTYQTVSKNLVVWEVETGRTLHNFPPPPTRGKVHRSIPILRPYEVAFTPDGKGLICRNGALQRWDLATGKAVFPDTDSWGHTEAVTRLLFSPDSKLLASSSRDGTARLWEVALGLPLHDFAIDANSHYLAFTPDGRQLLTVPDDFRKAAFQIWDVKSGRDVRNLTLADNKEFIPNRNNCGEVRVTPDGHRVLALTLKNGKTRNESILTVWDLATGQCLRHERVPWDESSILTPEGTGVVMLDSQTGEVKLRELEKGRPRQSFAPDWILNPQGPSNLALSPDNRHVAVGFQTKVTEQGVLRLGDLTTGQMFTLPVKGPAVSPSLPTLACWPPRWQTGSVSSRSPRASPSAC